MPDVERGPRRWGDDRALLDDDEARRRLLAATSRCIVRRGDAQVRMAEVADEAGVARSTVYRYFPTRADLILGLLTSRIDAALEAAVRSLPDPTDAARSIPDLILGPIGLVDGNPLNEALFSAESRAFVTSLELSSEALVDAPMRHYGPLFERWQADGQLHGDLDIRETMRWFNAISLVLLTPLWRERSTLAKREFLVQYLVRRGNSRIRVEEVATEAGVSRSTVYRYFKTREDLILGVFLSRVDAGMELVVQALRHPDDAARSIPDLILACNALVRDNELNQALLSPDGRSIVTSADLSSEPIVDGIHRHIGPLLERWQAGGQLQDDLDLRETTRWINTVALMLLTPPWLERSTPAKRTFLDRYLVRALVR